jgi:RND family efflux transporter MFP subunit
VALDEVLNVPVYSAPATVAAHNEPLIAAEIDARVIALPVQIGDRVSTNDTLARLDCSSHESRLAVARAELEIARAQHAHAREQLQRASNLNKNKSISAELLGQRRMELGVSQAEVKAREEAIRQATIDVGHCEIKAPFDAVVMDKKVSVGTFAARGMAIVSLLESSGQEVAVSLRENEAERLQQADELAFEAGGQRFPVRLRAMLPALDTITRTRVARLVFTGKAALPGTAGRLTWPGARQLLPADYLVRRDGELGVFVVNDNHAHFVAVPQAQEGRPVRVELAPDTRLITDGRQRLLDGDEVTVVPLREKPE